MRMLRYGALLVVVGLLAAGCAKQAPTEPPEPAATPGQPAASATPTAAPAVPAGKTILFISNANSPFWDAVQTGLEAGVKECGVPARLERNDGTVAGQIRLLEQALSSRDSLLGVAISALRPDADGLLQAMQKLRDVGLPVITVDSDCGSNYRDAFVGTNNFEAGKALGQKALELKPKGAKICMFVGDLSAQNAVDRRKGFLAGAGPTFTLVESYQDETDPTKARTNAESAMVAHSECSMLVGLWSYNGPAIAEAVENATASKHITVVTFDAEPNLLPLLEQGKVAATLAQRPYEMGRQGVLLLKALATGDEAAKKQILGDDDVVDTGMTIVTPETFKEFKQYLDEKGLKSS